MWDAAKENLKFHINGAQAITKSRDRSQNNSPIGKAMSEFLRVFMVCQIHVHRIDEY
jgi:hypothetical protein